jgi:Fur family ferric uptake transcriptional regulator
MPPTVGAKMPKEGRTLQDRKTTLRTSGLRSTAPRLAVLRELEAAESPCSHAELADKLVLEGFDRATVYRNLIDLTEAGLVQRSDHGDHIWRFELLRAETHRGGGPHPHPHFVCTECGTVSCLPESAIRISASRGTPRALERRAVEVQLKGACDVCAG